MHRWYSYVVLLQQLLLSTVSVACRPQTVLPIRRLLQYLPPTKWVTCLGQLCPLPHGEEG